MKERFLVTITMECVVEAYNVAEASQIAGSVQMQHGGSYGVGATVVSHRVRGVSVKEWLKPPSDPETP